MHLYAIAETSFSLITGIPVPLTCGYPSQDFDLAALAKRLQLLHPTLYMAFELRLMLPTSEFSTSSHFISINAYLLA